jgi:hypothetical protein
MKVMLGSLVVVAAVSAAVSAQTGQGMDKPAMAGKMTTTYTGCVEAVNNGSAWQLTHLTDDREKGMKDNGMAAKDDGTAMKKDDGMAMEKDPGPMMNGKSTLPKLVSLTGSSDLKKHVGQRVTVTGSLSAEFTGPMQSEIRTLTVSSLKVVAKSCVAK